MNFELDEIYNRIKADKSFVHLRQSGNSFVPGEGRADAGVCRALIIGEAPGAQEALCHRPFVGPAGKVQRELMGFAGLSTEDNCWLTNVIHYRPPGNRKPTPREISAMRPYIVEEWKALSRPRLIVTVGATALEAVSGSRMSVLRVSGHPRSIVAKDGRTRVWIWPMIHPSYGLRNKAVIPIIEKDWHALAEWRQRRISVR